MITCDFGTCSCGTYIFNNIFSFSVLRITSKLISTQGISNTYPFNLRTPRIPIKDSQIECCKSHTGRYDIHDIYYIRPTDVLGSGIPYRLDIILNRADIGAVECCNRACVFLCVANRQVYQHGEALVCNLLFIFAYFVVIRESMVQDRPEIFRFRLCHCRLL